MSRREHLVVVLPGIGGSVLAGPGHLETPVWTAAPGPVFDLLRHPDELDINRDLAPTGLIPTLRLFGVWTPVLGYDRLLARLGGLEGGVLDLGHPGEPVAGANVVAFPYDFRASIVAAAERLDTVVRERMAQLWPDEAALKTDEDPPEGMRPRVVLVAHSMGGLVARYWLAQRENWRWCRTLITLGTPHRGAPKALEVLVNGVPVGKRRTRLHLPKPAQVMRHWPAVFELLPRYPMIQVTGATADTATTTDSPDRSADTTTGVLLHPHELTGPGLGWFGGPAAKAWMVHREIEAGWNRIPRSGPDVTARIGYGHGTFQTASWDGRCLTVTTAAPSKTMVGDWADDLGDGTVPSLSGLPLEMDNHSGHGLRVPLTHSKIIDLDGVIDIVEALEGRPPLAAVHGEEPDPDHPVVLGLDVDDIVAAGDSVEVDARILGTPDDTTTVTVYATVTRLDDAGHPVRGTTIDTVLDLDTTTHPDDGGGTCGWAGELPARAPGTYRVRVSADAVPRGGSPSSERIVQVLEPGDVE